MASRFKDHDFNNPIQLHDICLQKEDSTSTSTPKPVLSCILLRADHQVFQVSTTEINRERIFRVSGCELAPVSLHCNGQRITNVKVSRQPLQLVTTSSKTRHTREMALHITPSDLQHIPGLPTSLERDIQCRHHTSLPRTQQNRCPSSFQHELGAIQYIGPLYVSSQLVPGTSTCLACLLIFSISLSHLII
jgi:hypothetical protein